MTEITLELPNSLADRIKPLGVWMPTIIELSLVGFRTRTAEAVSDLINFLEKNPPPQTVLQYHASTKSEERLYRLMALSEAGVLSAKEKAELAELEKLEHIVVMLKAKARKILKKNQ